MLFIKIFLVALSLVVQDKVFPEHDDPVSELDTLTLPEENPESALVRRAMEEEGLCPAALARADAGPVGVPGTAGNGVPTPVHPEPRGYLPDSLRAFASACD